MPLPCAIDQRWSLDIVSDTLSDRRRFRILCVVDDFSRECLATAVDTFAELGVGGSRDGAAGNQTPGAPSDG